MGLCRRAVGQLLLTMWQARSPRREGSSLPVRNSAEEANGVPNR